MPENDVPADAAVNVTVRSVAPVSSVTVIVLLICTGSLTVAVTVTVCVARYGPSTDDDENAVTVGAVVSIVTGSADAEVWVSVAPSSVVIAVDRNL